MTLAKANDNKARVVVLGAAGQMTSVTVKALFGSLADHRFTLVDLNREGLATMRREAPVEAEIDLAETDIYDAKALRSLIKGARYVIHGAGPFHETAKLVRSVAIEEGADYFDIDDDNESTLEAIDLGPHAAAAGTALYVGHGASPGFTNVMAADLMRRLDHVVDVEVAWTVGDEGAMELGRAVAEHTLHIGAGDCVTWSDGQRVVRRSFERAEKFPMGAPLGPYNLYECAHPETITLPHSFPMLRSAQCWGGMHPQAINGIVKGVAVAEAKGRLSRDEACSFIQDVMRGDTGSAKGWRYAFAGMLAQVRRGENTLGAMTSALADAARGIHRPTQAGMAARVRGWRSGEAVELTRVTNAPKVGTFSESMASMTGLSAAAFFLLLASGPRRAGFQPPERWADPEAFYAMVRSIAPEPDYPVLLAPTERRIDPEILSGWRASAT
jgi:saccharopine dehydrogenase-like NADP-dependent oxidoreductase